MTSSINEEGFYLTVINGLSYNRHAEDKWFDFYFKLFKCITCNIKRAETIAIINKKRLDMGYKEIILI